MEYWRSSRAVFRLAFHFVLITKYREPGFKGDVSKEERRLTKKIWRSHDIEKVRAHMRPDYVHMLLDVPPKMSPSKVM